MAGFPHPEDAEVFRDGVYIATFGAGFDPHADALYLPAGADILQADTVTFRDRLFRVKASPEVWRNPFTGWEAGTVAYLEETVSGYLPDLGILYRPGPTAWDPDLNTEAPTWTVVWSGPCLVETPGTAGTEAEAGEQRLSVQPFQVTVPLSVTDIRPDDHLTVTDSADPRLIGRPLQVTRVQAASLAQYRVFTAIDNQG